VTHAIESGGLIDTVDRHRFRTPIDVSHELERVRQLLGTVGKLTGAVDAPALAQPLDILVGEHALDAAVSAVSAQLYRASAEHDEAAWHTLLALLTELHQSRVFLRDAVLSQRDDAVVAVRESLARLRSVASVDQLVERLPDEVSSLGFRRTLVSRVHNGVWTSRAAFVEHDAELADLLVEASKTEPTIITMRLLESELVRRRKPMIIRDPQSNPRMHPKFKDISGTRCYVAAPVIAGESVIGFLHADEYLGSPTMDDFCRDLLGMFAEGVGHAVERIVYHERLQAIRGRLNDYTRTVSDLVGEFVAADVELSSPDLIPAQPAAPRPAMPLGGHPQDSAYGALTRRELEILRHMASGETNAQIASRLVLSEGTVKSHVKHILRKLGAVNRAQAVAKYHTATQQQAR
jgi:DNA-binding CsgD family transcriptional regulator